MVSLPYDRHTGDSTTTITTVITMEEASLIVCSENTSLVTIIPIGYHSIMVSVLLMCTTIIRTMINHATTTISVTITDMITMILHPIICLRGDHHHHHCPLGTCCCHNSSITTDTKTTITTTTIRRRRTRTVTVGIRRRERGKDERIMRKNVSSTNSLFHEHD